MELIDSLKYALAQLAECIKYILSTPSLWFKNVSFGDMLVCFIVAALIIWLFYNLLVK